MDTNKELEPKVEFSDSKRLLSKQSSRKTKIVVVGVLTALLFLGAVISVCAYFALRKTTPTRLTEVKLEEGETLTYQVDQNIEIQGGNVQKATIRAIVGIRVLNKTSKEYWFLMKFNLSKLGGEVDIKDVKTVTEYFLVRLRVDSRTPNHAKNKTSESFEVYGHRHTNAELLRLVYGILEQLLPTVKRDLYEDVDGVKATGSKALDPEESPLLPGSVRMHREANTSDKDAVVIKNHFDRADFVNLPSEIDLDLKYSDFALINKSNGMVSESRAYFSEQLNFGEPIHNKNGFDVTMMKITLTSHVSLIETNYFGYVESQRVSFHFFVKLVVPKSNATVSINKKPSRLPSKVVSNSSHSPLSTPSPGQQHNLTNSSSIPLKRSRRAASAVAWKEAGPLYLSVEQSFTVFNKKVIGINVKGEGRVWLEDGDAMEIGVSFGLSIGGSKVRDIFKEVYQRNELEDGKDRRTGYQWDRGITIYIPVLILSVGVDFSLRFQVNNQLNFPPDGNSLSPVKLAVEIEPFAEVTASIEAYVSAYLIRGGAYGDGTLVRVGLPVTLSYQAARSPGKKWCVNLSARLTALELSAGIFYQWWDWWGWDWGTRHILYEFGRWSAINRNWKVIERCS